MLYLVFFYLENGVTSESLVGLIDGNVKNCNVSNIFDFTSEMFYSELGFFSKKAVFLSKLSNFLKVLFSTDLPYCDSVKLLSKELDPDFKGFWFVMLALSILGSEYKRRIVINDLSYLLCMLFYNKEKKLTSTKLWDHWVQIVLVLGFS